jgi:uncharacterized RDD family membrane protein YckC
MKEPKRTLLALLVLAGGIWLHPALFAQDSSPAEAKPPTASPTARTNATDTGGVMAEAADQGTNTPSAGAANEASAQDQPSHGRDNGPLVSIGHDVELKAGETAESVVVIGGSAKIHGKVQEAAVAIWGDLDIDGEVGEAAVAVMGDLKVRPGGKIHEEAVAVGGKVDAAPEASIGGKPVTVDFPRWLKKWFLECALKLRPLSLRVGWVWGVAAVILLVYLLIAAVFPSPVEACVAGLTRRPATTFLFGLLAKLLVPVVLLILIATGIGALVVPFVVAAVVLGALVGKVGVLEWIGFKVGRQFGPNGLQNSLAALLIGAAIIVLLYLVPVLGLLTFGILSVWGLGAAVTAAFGGLRKELPAKPAGPSPGPAMAAMPAARPMQEVDTAAAGTGGSGAGWSGAGGPAAATLTMPSAPPVMPETLSYPRAGFWERMGAGFLDILLVSILGSVGHHGPLGFLIALAYFTGMWTWKGTTVGGIVLGLKVVRMDGQPVTFAVALVRALAAAFSIVVLFLGFLWIAWDSEKQGWHDKIAGTVVLKLPRGTPLVCL